MRTMGSAALEQAIVEQEGWGKHELRENPRIMERAREQAADIERTLRMMGYAVLPVEGDSPMWEAAEALGDMAPPAALWPAMAKKYLGEA